MSCHVAIHGAHDDQDEVVALDIKELGQIDVAYLNVSLVWVHINKIIKITGIMNNNPNRDDDKLNSNHCKNCNNLACFWCHQLHKLIFNGSWTHIQIAYINK